MAIERPLKTMFERPFPPDPPRPIPTIEIGRYGDFEVAYRASTTDVDVLEQSFDRDAFFAGIPEYRPSDEHVIIDLGAHIGTFSLLASSKVPRGKVYAVEACRESANLCRLNIALNRIPNIELAHLALADRKGHTRLHHGPGNWGHSIVSVRSDAGETVPTDTLTNFVEARGIDRCHLMKLNCEGAEFPILLSTPPEVLRRFEHMLVLYHCDLYEGRTEADLLSHLGDSGFTSRLRRTNPKRGWIIATRD